VGAKVRCSACSTEVADVHGVCPTCGLQVSPSYWHDLWTEGSINRLAWLALKF
jgi:predicted amidophosphoribosyltransferase